MSDEFRDVIYEVALTLPDDASNPDVAEVARAVYQGIEPATEVTAKLVDPENDGDAVGTICAVYQNEMMYAGIVTECEIGAATTGEDLWTIMLETGETTQHIASWCLVFDRERVAELRGKVS